MKQHKNYSKFSKPFKKKEENNKPMEGQITIDEVVNNDVLTGIVTGCEKLNIREKADKSGKVLTVLNKDVEVEVELDAPTTPDFYKVKTASGLEGYCMKQFITIK